jgi:hypothetical protein
MKGLMPRYEHHADLTTVQLALLEHFCTFSGLDIPTEKLNDFLNESRDLTYKEADLIWEPENKG